MNQKFLFLMLGLCVWVSSAISQTNAEIIETLKYGKKILENQTSSRKAKIEVLDDRYKDHETLFKNLKVNVNEKIEGKTILTWLIEMGDADVLELFFEKFNPIVNSSARSLAQSLAIKFNASPIKRYFAMTDPQKVMNLVQEKFLETKKFAEVLTVQTMTNNLWTIETLIDNHSEPYLVEFKCDITGKDVIFRMQLKAMLAKYEDFVKDYLDPEMALFYSNFRLYGNDLKFEKYVNGKREPFDSKYSKTESKNTIELKIKNTFKSSAGEKLSHSDETGLNSKKEMKYSKGSTEQSEHVVNKLIKFVKRKGL